MKEEWVQTGKTRLILIHTTFNDVSETISWGMYHIVNILKDCRGTHLINWGDF